MNKIIYLDNAATTKPLKEALEFAQKFNDECFYNPSSLYHGGVQNKSQINLAKQTLSKLVGADFDCIFTSCGTESDNTAIFSYSNRGNIVTTKGEHPAIYSPCNELLKKGYDVRFANINKDKLVLVDDLNEVIKMVKDESLGDIYTMVCFDMTANLLKLIKEENHENI